jgi:hypothetical protein
VFHAAFKRATQASFLGQNQPCDLVPKRDADEVKNRIAQWDDQLESAFFLSMHSMKESRRPFTVLGWIFSLACFPAGMFISLATGRVISWPKAVFWFGLFYGLQICFVRGMVHLESVHADQVVIQLFLLAGLSLLLIHHEGARHDYWSERDQKAWRILGRIGCILMLWNQVHLMIQMVVIPVWIQP